MTKKKIRRMSYTDKDGKKQWFPPIVRFEPNPRKYATNTERQRAYRERLKMRKQPSIWVFKKCVVCGDDTEVLAHVTIDGETYDLPICGGYDPPCSQKLMGYKPKTLIRLYRKTHFRVGYKA
jgi:hypothetical protein